MPAWICVTCAGEHPVSDAPPEHCAICEDERQYVGRQGQQWTTKTDLIRDQFTELQEEEPDLIGVTTEPT